MLNKMRGACSACGVEERFWWGNLKGKRQIWRPRRRWEYNIKMDFEEVECGGYGLDQAGSGYGRVAGTCESGDEPSGSIKCGEFLD